MEPNPPIPNSPDPSRFSKWVLLISSLVTVAFLIAAAVRENVTAEWRHYQQAYRELLAQRATDERGQKIANDFTIELRQISVPELDVVDRCVTCHNGIEDPRMKDAPVPFAAHSGKILEQHPIDKFGCTTCHGGQGAAVDFHNAKAEDTFWDYPLLPAKYTQASCASCHDPQRLPAETVPLLVKGRALFEAKSCGSCHKLDGKGGVLGLPLDNVGMKTKHQFVLANLKGKHTVDNWLAEHFRDPAGVVPGSLMKNPGLSTTEVTALTAYMLSLRQRDYPQKYMAPDKIEQAYARLHPAPPDGAKLYQQYCASCHDTGTYGRWDKQFQRFIPAIRNPAGLLRHASDDYLKQNIAAGRGALMPVWNKQGGGFSDAEIAAIIQYLRKDGPPAPAPAPEAQIPGDANRGAVVFIQNCSGCHGNSGKNGAPNLADPTLQKTAGDAYLFNTIADGRPGTAMPSWARKGAAGLSAQQIADVVAFIRALGANPNFKHAPMQTAMTNTSGRTP